MLYSPKNKKELVEVLKVKDNNTYFIAGGTDLVIKIKNKKLTNYNLIDLTKIDDFKKIYITDEYVYIGSMVTMTELTKNDFIKKEFKSIHQAAYNLGSEQIRNLATIGGNIANASQSADVLLASYSLKAKVKVLNKNNEERIVPISDLVIGKEKISLESDEVITEVILERKKNRVTGFTKVGSRKAVTISKINCAIDLEISKGLIDYASLYFGAVGVVPTEAKLIEEYLKNKNLKDINVEELKNLATEEIDIAIPTRSSRHYKRMAVKGLIEDLIQGLSYE